MQHLLQTYTLHFISLGALRRGAYYLFAVMTWREQVKNTLRIVPSCVLTAIRKKLVFLPSSGNSIAYRVGSVWTEVQHSLSFRLDRLLDTMLGKTTCNAATSTIDDSVPNCAFVLRANCSTGAETLENFSIAFSAMRKVLLCAILLRQSYCACAVRKFSFALRQP